MFEELADVFVLVLDPSTFGYLFLGVGLGLLVGLLPGLGGITGLTLLLPFVYGMDLHAGIAMMMGLVAVTSTSDTFMSVLLGVPGSASSQATIMDGYPLARKGQAARALGASFTASLIGGLLGATFLLGAIWVARPLILTIGSPQLFMLTLVGLSMVALVSRGPVSLGLLAGVVGLLLGSVGAAPMAPDYRFTFDLLYLRDGIPLVAVGLGLFAFPEIVSLLVQNKSIARAGRLRGGLLGGMRETLQHKWLVVRSSVVGTAIGMIPGIGGSIIDWITYGLAKKTSKNSSDFGNGDIRGVIAPESANNAKEGGTLVPTLLFGVPGSGSTAILLGAFVLMGVQPGPRMATDHLDLILVIIWTLAIANILAAVVSLSLARQIAKVTLIPPRLLAPFLMIILVLAAYQHTRSWQDIVAFLVVGIFAYLMKEAGVPRAPLLIGFVLSLTTERYLHLSYQRYGFEFLTDPIVLALGLLIVAVVGSTALASVRQRHRSRKAADEPSRRAQGDDA